MEIQKEKMYYLELNEREYEELQILLREGLKGFDEKKITKIGKRWNHRLEQINLNK